VKIRGRKGKKDEENLERNIRDQSEDKGEKKQRGGKE
jgi:hypothetical protein